MFGYHPYNIENVLSPYISPNYASSLSEKLEKHLDFSNTPEKSPLDYPLISNILTMFSGIGKEGRLVKDTDLDVRNACSGAMSRMNEKELYKIATLTQENAKALGNILHSHEGRERAPLLLKKLTRDNDINTAVKNLLHHDKDTSYRSALSRNIDSYLTNAQAMNPTFTSITPPSLTYQNKPHLHQETPIVYEAQIESIRSQIAASKKSRISNGSFSSISSDDSNKTIVAVTETAEKFKASKATNPPSSHFHVEENKSTTEKPIPLTYTPDSRPNQYDTIILQEGDTLKIQFIKMNIDRKSNGSDSFPIMRMKVEVQSKNGEEKSGGIGTFPTGIRTPSPFAQAIREACISRTRLNNEELRCDAEVKNNKLVIHRNSVRKIDGSKPLFLGTKGFSGLLR